MDLKLQFYSQQGLKMMNGLSKYLIMLIID